MCIISFYFDSKQYLLVSIRCLMLNISKSLSLKFENQPNLYWGIYISRTIKYLLTRAADKGGNFNVRRMTEKLSYKKKIPRLLFENGVKLLLLEEFQIQSNLDCNSPVSVRFFPERLQFENCFTFLSSFSFKSD